MNVIVYIFRKKLGIIIMFFGEFVLLIILEVFFVDKVCRILFL